MSVKSSEGFVRSRRAGRRRIVGKDVCCSVVQYLMDSVSETELRSKWWLLQ